MLVLIAGADHRIQWIPKQPGQQWAAKIREFVTYIQQQCQRCATELVAEEFSEHYLVQNDAVDSTARLAAKQIGLPHLFCDPDPKERLTQHIKSSDDREAEWLRRMNKFGSQRVLFICGDSHVDSFAAMLHKNGHKANILSRDWGKGWEFIH